MNNQVSVRTSMVRFCTILSFSILFFLTSCTGLLTPRVTQRGSFSITISEDIIKKLENSAGYARVARSADSPVFTATVALNRTSGGSLIEPVSITGSSVQLVNRTIVIDNVPLGVQFTVTMTFLADGVEIISGTSNPVTLTTTDVTDIPLTLRFSEASTPFYSNLLIGTWAFDSGFNQEVWIDEQITFYEDGNADCYVIYPDSPDYNEWNKARWSLKNDKGRMTLVLQLTESASSPEEQYHDINITKYYTINVDGDELILNRTKLTHDTDNMYFDPPVYNHFYRVKNGTQSQLVTDKWTAVKNSDYWDNHCFTWTFSPDGVMQDFWTEDSSTQNYQGTYDIIQQDGKTILYQNIDFGGGSSQEVWYRYTSLGPNLICVETEKIIENGEEGEPGNVMYAYRDVPLVEYTYHIEVSGENYTFTDYWPTGKAYTLLDFSKRPYIQLPENLFELALLSWHADESCSGSAISSISAASNTTNRDFYAKWGLKGHHNGNDEQYCWSTNLYAKDQLPRPSFQEGGMVLIHLEANLSRDINGSTQIKFWGDGGYDGDIGMGETEVHTKNRHLSADYYIDTKVTPTDSDNITLEIVYNQETGPVTFSDYTVDILDDSNSYRVDYHVGGRTYKDRVPAGETKILPDKAEYFNKLRPDGRTDYNALCLEIAGWYNEPGFSSSPITSISPLSPGEKQDVYLKFNPKIGRWDDPESHDGWHNYSATLPAETLLPGVDFRPEPDDTVYLYVEAQLSDDLHGNTHLELADGAHDFWWLCASEEKCVYTQDGKLAELYTIHIPDEYYFNEHLVEHFEDSDLCIDFVYHPDALDRITGITDYKVTLVDENSTRNINYHIGNVVCSEKYYTLADFILPENLMHFAASTNWNIENDIAFSGWYYDENAVNNPVTEIHAYTSQDKDVYLKFNPILHRNNYTDQWDYDSVIPARVFLSESSLNAWYGKNDPITVRMSAKINPIPENNGPMFFEFIYTPDNGDWQSIAWTETSVNIAADTLTAEFHLNCHEGMSYPADINDLLIKFGYPNKFYGDEITFSNVEFVILDNTNSYTLNYHIGNMVLSERVYAEAAKTLPRDMMYFDHYNSEIAHNLELVGWCSDSSLSSPISQIAANQANLNTTKDVYLNYKLRLHRYAPENGNISNYFPVAMFLTKEQISSIVSGNSPAFTLSAILTEFAADSACNLTIVDTRYDEWTPLASKESIHPEEIFQFDSTNQVADPPSIENLAIDINIGEYSKEKGDDCTVSGFVLTETN